MSIIRLTSVCNQKCLFCNFPSESSVLDFKQAQKEIDGISGDSVSFTGGEPTTYPYIREVIFYAKEKGFKEIELQSNCMVFDDLELVKDLKESGLTNVFVTIHSEKAEVFDKITQVTGSYRRTVQGIKNLINAGVFIRINVVINSLNYSDLLSITKFIHNEFSEIKGIDYSFVVPTDNVLKRPELLPKLSQVAPYLLMAYEYCQKNKIKFQNPCCGIPLCFVQQHRDVSLEYKLLSSGRGNNQNIVNNQKEKIKFNKCKKCQFDKYCLGFWENYCEIYGDEEFN